MLHALARPALPALAVGPIALVLVLAALPARSGTINLCHQAKFQLFEGMTPVQDVVMNSDNTTPRSGTLLAGQAYTVVLQFAASSQSNINSGPNPAYCGARAALTFSVDQVPPQNASDSAYHFARTRVGAYTSSTKTVSDTSNGFGQFGFSNAATLQASQQTATAITRSRSEVLGPSLGNVSLNGYVITSAWNDFTTGFPDPTAFGEGEVRWRLHPISNTGWNLDVDVDVETQPGHSVTLPHTPIFVPTQMQPGPILYLTLDDTEYGLVLVEQPTLFVELATPEGLIVELTLENIETGEPSLDAFEVAVGSQGLGTFAAGQAIDLSGQPGGGAAAVRFRAAGAGIAPVPAPIVFRLGLTASSTVEIQPVPEPSASAMAFSAAVALTALRQRRPRRRTNRPR